MLSLLFLILSFPSFGQFTDGDIEILLGPLNEEKKNKIMEYKLDDKEKIYTRLVSNRTFSKTVKEDFYKVSKTSDKNDAIVGKYASLSLDSDKSTFTLTPFSGVGSKKSNIGLFRNIFSFDISGSIDNNKNFSLKDYKKISAGFSLVHIKEAYNFDPFKRPATERYIRLYDAVLKELKKEASKKLLTIADSLNHNPIYTKRDTNQLIELYHTKVKDSENKLIGKAWTKKYLIWHKFNIKLLSWESLTYIPQSLLKTATSVNRKTIATPSLKYIFNFYKGTNNNHNFFFNMGAGLAIKHTLSEVTTQLDWYKYTVLSDSTLLGSSTKIFTPTESNIRSRWRPDISGQLIYLHTKNKFKFGAEAFYSTNWLLTPTELTGRSHLQKILFGLIFPITTKDKKTTVVLEPFIEWKLFNNYVEGDSRNIGVKFSLPFNSLF